MQAKRFRIEFSGKAFPEYYPPILTVPAPDIDRAKEWAQKQLKAWNLEEGNIRVSVVEHLIETPEPPKEKDDKNKKKGK